MKNPPAITLLRVEQTPAATFGVIIGAGRLICLTLELPWRDNQKDVSCVPVRVYRLMRRDLWKRSKRYGHTYQLANVPDRTGVLIHPANSVDELEGCIAPGLHLGEFRNQRCLLKSAPAFGLVKQYLGGAPEAYLSITRLAT